MALNVLLNSLGFFSLLAASLIACDVRFDRNKGRYAWPLFAVGAIFLSFGLSMT